MTSQALVDAFNNAKREFLSQFPNGTPANFEEFNTINDVYKAAEDIQLAQAKTRTTRNLRKIQPFLECLRHYGDVIETFVTVKPDILALIWGPIKFLLLTSSTYIKSFDKLIDAMAQISLSLPAFEKYTKLFPGSQPIQQVLCLFYQDILDFYSTVLVFFKHKKWSVFFESLWPKSAGRIRVITENIEKHRMLMDGSITLAHVIEAHAARQRSFEEYERQHDFRQRQDLEAVKSSLSPVLYDRDLQRLKACWAVRSGDWLLEQEQYISWIDPSDRTSRLLWLQGIPGAGKTFVSSSIVDYIAARGDPMVFAFLNYQSRESISTLQLLHSFIWQMALDYKMLQRPLILAHQQEYRRFNSDPDFIKDLFSQFLDSMPTMFIIIDGLDEVLPADRLQMLRIIMEILGDKSNVKILVSSRPEDDISRIISKEAQPLRVHDCNNRDIEAYVDSRASSLISDVNLFESSLAQEITNLMKAVAVRSQGMFLYARLVCDSIGVLGDIESIKEAIHNLPDGLDEAYDRILFRITDGLEERQREDARQILALVTCGVVPLSKNEIKLAVYTARGRDPSKGCKGLFLNILDRCGPIIEDFDGKFRFVHFSAREYLLSPQSKHYLTEPAAHACITSICIQYLSSACFDVDVEDEDLGLRILSGAFVLLHYVCNHWLYHLGKAGRQCFQSLRHDIERLVDTRANPSFVDGAYISMSPDAHYSKSLGSTEEKLAHKLDNAHSFSKKLNRDLSFDEYGSWKQMDPLTFSKTEAKFRNSLEFMLCETSHHKAECVCQELKNLYGRSIYKCSRPGCLSYRVGFDTPAKRDEHIRKHTRPFKCQKFDCPYAEFGFTTENGLDLHSTQAHEQRQSNVTTPWTKVSSREVMKAILIDAVKENDLSTLCEREAEVKQGALSLLLVAYQEGSSEAMIKHLLNTFSLDSYQGVPTNQLEPMISRIGKILEASIDHGNHDVFYGPRELFTFWMTHNHRWPATHSMLVFQLIGKKRCADLIELVSSEPFYSQPDPTYSERANFRTTCISLIPSKPDAQAELLTLECLNRAKLHPYFPQLSEELLKELGRGCCSISIAEFLLENGANFGRGVRWGQKPIIFAAQKTSLEAAKFMEFLLKRGAHAPLTWRGKLLHEHAGPRNIHKWIGITWKELVN